MKSNERFPLPLPLLRYVRLSKLGKINLPVQKRFCIRVGVRVGDSSADGCRSPFPFVVEPLYCPALIDTLRLDLELPLLSRVDIQVVKGIQLGPVAPYPTGCPGTARAFDFHRAGRERNGDLGVG